MSPINVHLAEHMAKELGVEVDHELLYKEAKVLDSLNFTLAASGCKNGGLALSEGDRRYYMPPAFFFPYGDEAITEWRESFAVSMRKRGFRTCAKQSACKHRKRGDLVVPLGGGLFAWKPPTFSAHHCGGVVGPRQGEVAALLSSRCEHVGVLPPENY